MSEVSVEQSFLGSVSGRRWSRVLLKALRVTCSCGVFFQAQVLCFYLFHLDKFMISVDIQAIQRKGSLFESYYLGKAVGFVASFQCIRKALSVWFHLVGLYIFAIFLNILVERLNHIRI